MDERPLRILRAALEAECAAACAALEGCGAAAHDVRTAMCELMETCLLMEADVSGVVVHFTLAGPRPSLVSWSTIAIVVCHYRATLGWMRRLAATDNIGYQLAVYSKMNLGAGESRATATVRRAVADAAGARLTFHQTLPNLGRQGGGREPHAYLSFVRTFLPNLPHTVIFTQVGDCEPERALSRIGTDPTNTLSPINPCTRTLSPTLTFSLTHMLLLSPTPCLWAWP